MVGGVISTLIDVGFDPSMFASLIVLFPLALIWFPDVIGESTEYFLGRGVVDVETLPRLVAAMQCFFLVGLPATIMLLVG